MLNQSTLCPSAVFAPITLDPVFPVAEPDHQARPEIPIEAHVHDCFEIGFCNRGSGVFLVENKILPFRAGDAAAINHRELHTMKGSPGGVADWHFVNLAPVALLSGTLREDIRALNTDSFSGHEFNNILAYEAYPELCHTIRCIIQEMLEKRQGYQSAVKALVWEMLVRLGRIKPAGRLACAPEASERDKLELIAPALKQIASHYHEPITVETLARKCNYSESNFRKVFVAATGYAPRDYVLRLRLEAAASMLRGTGEGISMIAFKIGFPTLSNFNRQFKALFGMSPGRWRAADAAEPAIADRSPASPRHFRNRRW